MSSVSSFRSHRVIIASLFLPTTVIIDEPDSFQAGTPTQKALDVPRASNKPSGPLKSIVEDLAGKTVQKPTTEKTASPFSVLRRSSSRLRRRQSRSSSRPRISSNHEFSSFTSDAKIFNVDSNPQCNGGLKNAIDSVGDKMRKKLWVGTLGSAVAEVVRDDLQQSVSSRLRGEHESEVVWIDETVFERMYDGFCHQVLWPALHYAIPDAPKTKLFYESERWADYVSVNRSFAQKIAQVWREGDIVFVNDYHLMLLPAMLREGGIPFSAPIGFFLHVAFPSSEIFRCLSVRESLLRGVLGADLIGFQTASYARHFRQTVSRILSVEASPRGIQLSGEFDSNPYSFEKPSSTLRSKMNSSTAESSAGRFVDVGVFPMGIDVWRLKERKLNPEVAEWITILKQRYMGMKLLVGRDKLDDIQGVRQKIMAFEAFLDKHPEYAGKIVLIQIALPSSASLSQGPLQNPYTIPSDILAPLSHINSKYSNLTYQPVVFLHTQDVSFSQYLALMKVADGFIVTSLREGMALRTHEFVVMQEKEGGSEREGVLILSEFTGSYSYSGFRSCIAVNPWDTRGTADAIYQALTMDDEEAHNRWEELNDHVNAQTAQAFVTSFLTRCLRANAEHQDRYSSTPSRGRPSFGATRGEETSMKFRTRNLNEDLNRIMGRWRHSQRRLVLVDWEGTLYPLDDIALIKGSTTDHTALSTADSKSAFDQALTILQKLSDNKKNEIWLLSGLPVKGTLSHIAEKVPKVGVVAENGCFIKPRQNRSSSNVDWMNMVPNLNMAWKAPCLTSLNYFTERTPGSFVEERDASVVWHFWTGVESDEESGDRQWARRQAAEAQNHIFDSLGERYGLRIIPGSNSFLVLPNNISRSTAVGTILQLGSQTQSPVSSYSLNPLSRHSANAAWANSEMEDTPNMDDLEIVLAVSSDQKLLRRLNELDNSETVSIGNKGTDAKWILNSHDVPLVLNRFAEV